MTSARSLTFLWTPASVAISIVAVAVTASLCVLAWRRSGYRKAIGVLELLRFLIVSIAALLLNQPEWIEEYRPEEKPTIAVLWDGSGSMLTRDVEPTGSVGAGAVTRAEAIAPFTAEASWQKLHDRLDVTIESFSPAAPGKGTDLHTPLQAAANRGRTLLGVVLLSDGDWNEGEPPVLAAARLRARGVPVFAVPVGSPGKLPDLDLLSLDVPTFGVAGKGVRIPFTIESSLPREHVTTVTLRTSEGEEVVREVRVAPMGRTTDSVLWLPRSTGDLTLTLEVPRQSDETIVENNRMSAPISIRESKLKVLLIESSPRWEYRYLRNALSRDTGVELSCLLFQPGLSKAGGGNKDYLKQFPTGLDELSKYDVVFLGDVGTDDGQLTPEQCHQIRGLVEQQASGLVFLPGWQGRQYSLLETELADLFPVLLDTTQVGGWGARTPGRFELTETGRRSLLTKLADTQEDNVEVWEELPGFQWYAAVQRARVGAEVLAVHKDMTNEHGRLPLLVTRTFGAGKVLFLGTDGAWRWRRGVEDKYHYRFWGQVVRWMAYQRNMARGESMRLFYSPEQPRAHQTLALSANVMERSGEPLANGEVMARITAPSGKVDTVRFTTTGEEWGMFQGRHRVDEPGRHQVVLTCKQTGATLETAVFVQGGDVERVGRPARPEVLEEIARLTRGKVMDVSRIDQVVESLARLPEPDPSVRRVQLWSNPVVAGILVFLLGVFWVVRKAVGLV